MDSLELSEKGSEITEVAKKLIGFRTTNDNLEELMSCSDYIEEYFKDSDVHVKRFMHNNVPSLFISLEETNEPDIILSAHFDVVPAQDHHFECEFEDNYLLGRGAIDNKGPLAILMVLLKELSEQKNRPNVALLTTGDEEIGGYNGVKYILENEGIKGKFGLVIDGGGFNKYVVKSKGLITLNLISKGVSVHASRPWKGENAVENLMQAYSKISKMFKDSNDKEWEKTLNLGTIKGGEAANMVPHMAEMSLDIRYTEKDNAQKLIDEIKEICEECGKIQVDVILNEPLFNSDENNQYFKNLLDVSKNILGKEPEIVPDFGSSDARFFTPTGIPCALTCPDGNGSHTKREHMDLTCIEDFYEILKKFLLENA